MAGHARTATLEKIIRLRRMRRVQNAATLAVVLAGPILAVITFLVLGPLDRGATTWELRLILLADLVYVLVVAALVLSRIARMIAARRAKSAGSRLHLRLTRIFAVIALVPTVTVAIFAGLTINVGLEGWFAERVRGVVGASLTAAEAYREDQRNDLENDVAALADYLNAARRSDFFLSEGGLRQVLAQGQGLVQRGLSEAFVIDGTGEIRARGEESYLFDFEAPSEADLQAAREGNDAILIEDIQQGELRGLIQLAAFPDRYLYVSREVDGRLLGLLDEAAETAKLYQQLEAERGRLVFEFGLLYLAFAVILILAAIWLGLWLAEGLSRPVGRLAGAAQRVGAGDLDVRVKEEQGDDEIAMLGRIFNQMTQQLKVQRETLLETNRQSERRRRLFDSVLSSVTSGVVGVTADGHVTFVNRAAERLLAVDEDHERDLMLDVAVPEFAGLYARHMESGRETDQEEIRVIRDKVATNLLVRIATRRTEDGSSEGFVIAFEDVTDLVTAQRMAAWGDVARRIAHEIKNPLTPIQLSAERIKRKFTKVVGDDADKLEQMTSVIIRQTGDLRRIVDEFSKFARMPEPERKLHDLVPLIRDAVLLQESDSTKRFDVVLPENGVLVDVDSGMLGQALTNLLKNAGEAIDSLYENARPDGHVATIRVALWQDSDTVHLHISDNGIGLPEDRARLFEPYVTTREKGTGLGLPIVKKIVEEHGGTLTLADAEPLDDTGHVGARVELTLPLAAEPQLQAGDLKVAE